MAKDFVEGIKNGTKLLWLGRHGKRDGGILEVMRMTATQFVLARPSQPTYVVRIRRDSGFEVGGTMFCYKVTSIASPEEVAAYDAKEAQEKAEYEQRQTAEKLLKEKQQSLSDLFKDGAYVTTETHCSGFSVKLSGLTEEQVKTLAKLVENLRQ
jgi:hypothetical protein